MPSTVSAARGLLDIFSTLLRDRSWTDLKRRCFSHSGATVVHCPPSSAADRTQEQSRTSPTSKARSRHPAPTGAAAMQAPHPGTAGRGGHHHGAPAGAATTSQHQHERQHPASLPAQEPLAARAGCIAAVVENRAKEVGLALYDPSALDLRLCQFIEPGRAYTTTLLLLTEVGVPGWPDLACLAGSRACLVGRVHAHSGGRRSGGGHAWQVTATAD